MPAVFCFIDDAQFELANFRRNAASDFSRAEFVYATSFAQAVDLLAGRRPLCFLLDLYGAKARADQVPDQQQIDFNSLINRIPEQADAAALGRGLSQAGREAGNLFLRRLYAQVESWQKVFLDAAELLGQSRAYGLTNLAAVRERFPWAAAVGYSRKALYADAAAASLAGMDGVLQKPQGADDESIARATRAAAPGLAQGLYRAVNRRLSNMITPLALKLSWGAGGTDLAEALGQALNRLSADQAEPGPVGGPEVGAVLAPELVLKGALSPWEKEAIFALRDWLASM